MRFAECHSDRKYFAKGLCKQCYHKQRIRSKRPTFRDVKYRKENLKTYANYSQKWRKLHPNASREYLLKSLYNLSIEDFTKLSEKQHNLCAICYQPPKGSKYLYIDHNHKTGKIRGLLCRDCNSALGLFHDNITSLEIAIKYLEEYNDGSN